ncbi:MAG: hypothetical protein ACRD2T_10305, partial [Thermoanaerobaculia bacterium]
MRRPGGPLAALATLGLLTAPLVRGAGAEIQLVTDPDCFSAAVGPAAEVDFEELPFHGSSCPGTNDPVLPNPLELSGVKFTARGCLQSTYCAQPFCEPDPGRPRGGNIMLLLPSGSSIEFPPGSSGALLQIQQSGPYPFRIRAADRAGDLVEAAGKGVEVGTTHLGFIAPRGLA